VPAFDRAPFFSKVVLLPQQAGLSTVLMTSIDGFTDVTQRLSVETSGEPLEDGVLVQDHAVARAERISLRGWVSDLTIPGPVGVVLGVARAAAAWSLLRRLHRELIPVRVLTPWGLYDEMLITEAEAEAHGRGLRFSLSLGQVIRVGVGSADIVGDAVFGPGEGRTSLLERGRVALRREAAGVRDLVTSLPSRVGGLFGR